MSGLYERSSDNSAGRKSLMIFTCTKGANLHEYRRHKKYGSTILTSDNSAGRKSLRCTIRATASISERKQAPQRIQKGKATCNVSTKFEKSAGGSHARQRCGQTRIWTLGNDITRPSSLPWGSGFARACRRYSNIWEGRLNVIEGDLPTWVVVTTASSSVGRHHRAIKLTH